MMKQNRPGHAPPRSPPRMRISCSCDIFACAGEVVWDGSRAVVERNMSVRCSNEDGDGAKG